MTRKEFDIILGDFIEVNVPSYTGLQDWVTVREPHEYAHIDFYTTKGGELIINGKKYIEEANTILCIPKNKAYKGTVKNELHQYYSFLFTYTTNNKNDEFPFPIIFKPKDPQYFLDKFKQAYKISIIQPYGYKTKLRKIIYDVISKIIDEHYTRIDNDNGGYTIRKSINYIHEHFDNPDINLPEISAISGITDTHFRRVFKKVYGMNPSKYINKLRLDKARTLLTGTNSTVEDISYKCGYNNYSYFARAFKVSFGVTPTDYRNQNSNKGILI